jgi:hypothetical protein
MGLFIVVSSSYQKLGPNKELDFLGTLARRVHFAYELLAYVSFCLQNRQIDT